MVHLFLVKGFKNSVIFGLCILSQNCLGWSVCYLIDIAQVCAYRKEKCLMYYRSPFIIKVIYQPWKNVQEMNLHNKHTNKINTPSRTNEQHIY